MALVLLGSRGKGQEKKVQGRSKKAGLSRALAGAVVFLLLFPPGAAVGAAVAPGAGGAAGLQEVRLVLNGKPSPSLLGVWQGEEVLLPALALAELTGRGLLYEPGSDRLSFLGGEGEGRLTVNLAAGRMEDDRGRVWAERAPVVREGMGILVPAVPVLRWLNWMVAVDKEHRVVAVAQPGREFNLITAVEVRSDQEKAAVLIQGTSPVECEVTEDRPGRRLVVRLPRSYVGALPDFRDDGRSPLVDGVSFQQVGDEGRINIELKGAFFGFRVRGEPSLRRLVVELPLYVEERLATTVVPGLVYRRIKRLSVAGPIIADILEADLREPGLTLKPVLAREGFSGTETVSSLARRYGAIAGVNGGYFHYTGDTLGAVIIDGEMLSEPIRNRTVFALTEEGTPLILNLNFCGRVTVAGRELPLHGINRWRGKDELILYTPAFGSSTRTNSAGREYVVEEGRVSAVVEGGNAPIPRGGFVLSAHGAARDALAGVRPGDVVAVDPATEPDWRALGIRQAVGGGPRLLQQGEVHITAEEEEFRPDVAVGRAPRTGIGLTPEGKVIFAVVSGRRPGISVGMTLAELAWLLRDLGAVEAMNLDGGGSTALVIRDRVFNLPSDGRERAVSNAILFFAQP
ncbi:MAG: phosphodiester glycosidase family protein [Bacillota bacterium]|nr:phosphodiester glycosidase family protein [Bacillota bacterium]